MFIHVQCLTFTNRKTQAALEVENYERKHLLAEEKQKAEDIAERAKQMIKVQWNPAIEDTIGT